MKFDLYTSIGVAVLGVLIAFFATNFFIQPLEDYKFTAIDDASNSDSAKDYNYANLEEPSNEVFNYDALNPTVEVYVGKCENYDENGDCIDSQIEGAGEEEEETTDDNSDSETGDQENE